MYKYFVVNNGILSTMSHHDAMTEAATAEEARSTTRTATNLHAVDGIVENPGQQQPGDLSHQRSRENLTDHRELVLTDGHNAAEQPRERTFRRQRLAHIPPLQLLSSMEKAMRRGRNVNKAESEERVSNAPW